tara:strand:- start:283 stop:552 length:270 start_codon:yes stop_codon:yes gene_type:complete
MNFDNQLACAQNKNTARFYFTGDPVIYGLDEAMEYYYREVVAEADTEKSQKNQEDLIDFIEHMELEEDRHRIAEQRAIYYRERSRKKKH